MPRSKVLFYLLVLLVGLFSSPEFSYAQAIKTKPTATAKPVQIRYPDYQKLKDFRAKREFQYGEDLKPPTSFWERLMRAINRFLSRVFSTNANGNGFWTYAMYALAAGIIIFIILKLLQVDFVGLFRKKATSVPIPYETYRENIHEINFPALIEEAESQGDYRRAIRLHYLHILKNLTDKELINWNPAKTNRSYAKELGTTTLRQPFENITQLFEYVWYGGLALDKNHFQMVRLAFQEFNQNLKLRA